MEGVRPDRSKGTCTASCPEDEGGDPSGGERQPFPFVPGSRAALSAGTSGKHYVLSREDMALQALKS